MPKPIQKKSVRYKITYLASFNQSRAFQKPLNGSETMNILAIKGPGDIKSVTQLQVIGKIEYATLVINQFLFYTVKLCLTGNIYNNLHLMLKKQGNFGKDLNHTSLKSIINFSIRPDKVEKLRQLIVDNEKAQNMVRI